MDTEYGVQFYWGWHGWSQGFYGLQRATRFSTRSEARDVKTQRPVQTHDLIQIVEVYE